MIWHLEVFDISYPNKVSSYIPIPKSPKERRYRTSVNGKSFQMALTSANHAWMCHSYFLLRHCHHLKKYENLFLSIRPLSMLQKIQLGRLQLVRIKTFLYINNWFKRKISSEIKFNQNYLNYFFLLFRKPTGWTSNEWRSKSLHKCKKLPHFINSFPNDLSSPTEYVLFSEQMTQQLE